MHASHMKVMQHNFSSFIKRLSFLLALVFLLFAGEVANAQFPYSQTFRNSSASDIVFGGNGTIATLTAGSVDQEGKGYLRLTNNHKSQAGFARSTTSFSSDKGFSISFEYYTYGGSGDADGISFFLYDATASPFNIGDLGGSLGYAPNGSIAGLSKAYIGFGFDEFGNFSATHLGGPGQVPNSVTLRGDGNGTQNTGVTYKYLTGIQTTNSVEMSSISAGPTFNISGGVDGRDKGADGLKPSHPGYRKALIKMVPNNAGNGFIINVWITEGSVDGGIMHHLIKDYAYRGASLPQNLSYGFAGSTGDHTNFHEIRNLTIDLPEELNSIVVANATVTGNENDDIIFSASDFTSKYSSVRNVPLAKIKVITLPATGHLILNGTDVIAGQEIPVNSLNHLIFRPDAGFSGLTPFGWNGSDGSIYSDNSAFVNVKVTAIPSRFPYAETFTRSLAKGIVYGGSPLAASLTSGNGDPEGNGFLRLTNNGKFQLGFARSTAAFPSENGFSISFDYFSYGGNGADGISFFLFDAAPGTFNIGEPGGSLGYAGSSTTPGVSKAYIGFGLDEFGNFSSAASGGPGQFPSSVTIRGNGNGHMGVAGNYSYLTGIQTTDAAAMSAAGSGAAFNVSGGADGRAAGTPLSGGYRNAKIEMVPNGLGTGYIINVWITEGALGGEIKHHVIKNYSYTGSTPPANLSFGFAASSGDYTNYHEIRNMTMVVPPSVILNTSVAEIKKSTKEDVFVNFDLADFTSNFYDPYAFNTLTKVMFTALTGVNQGVLKLNGINVIANQEISLADISASKLSFVPAPNFNGTTAGIKWTGFNGVESAPVSADVNIEVLSVNDEPSGQDKTLTFALNTNYILQASDFGFSDASDIVQNTFKSVIITSLPASGTLKLDNITITAGVEIAFSAIHSNLLSFTPGVDGFGLPYASFKFKVRDNGGVLNGGTDVDQSENVITLNVVQIPSINLTNANLVVCSKSASANILFDAINGSVLPNVYSIDWDGSANLAGIADVTDANLAGLIVVNNLTNVKAGTYNGLLTVRNTANSFVSTAIAVTLTITPGLTANISYSSSIFCAIGKAQVISSGDEGGVFTSSEGLLINPQTGELDLEKSKPGVYMVNYSLSNQSCSISTSTSVEIKALPVVPAIIGAGEIPVGSTIQLSNSLVGGIWESYNTEYATVSAAGLVKGLKSGIANISYTIKSGNCVKNAIVKILVGGGKGAPENPIVPFDPQLSNIVLTNPNQSVCFKSASATIDYELSDGSIKPDLYSINWDSQANLAGIPDVSDQDLNGGVITINKLSAISAGTYKGILTVRSSSNSSVGKENTIELTITPPLKASITYSRNIFCASGKAQVTLSGDKGGMFSSATGLSINSSTGELDLEKSIPGSYTITYSINNQSCPVNVTSSIEIKALPAVPEITGAGEISVGGTIQLSNTLVGGVWESYNTEYAIVNADGIVKGVKAGVANILYTIKSGSCYASAVVKIAVSQDKNVNPEKEIKSSDASLSSLVLSKGNLSPAFDANTLTYSSSVENEESSITVKPGADAKSTVKVNGTIITESNSSKVVDLTVGNNKITIEVIAADGHTVQTYTLSVNRSAPSLLYNESFKNPTASGLVFGGGSANSARLTGGNTDATGSGYLRLTSNQKENSGFARSTTLLPSAKGYSISFEYFMYGGSGGEGMTFFLYDAAANNAFNVGGVAGSLGYAQRSDLSAPGLSKAFLGLGLDQAGNFSNAFQGRQGGPGIRNSSVVLRGDGNGTGAGAPAGSNYEYLTGVQTANAAAMVSANAGKQFQLAGGQDGRTAQGGSLDSKESGYRKVRMDMEPNASGTGFKINVYITENTDGILTTHHLIKDFAYTPTNGVPKNLSYGFSASTGATNNFHEIRNLEITAAGKVALPVVTVSSDEPTVKPPVVITDPETVVPNATNLITPNGDGINDKWIIRNLEKFPSNVVRIFDRSGRIVYTKKNYTNDWEGTFNGNVLEMGTYYYVVDFGSDAKAIKGYISVLR